MLKESVRPHGGTSREGHVERPSHVEHPGMGSPYLAEATHALERSSISWRAIFAGVFISLLVYFILTFLGLAIGGSTLQGLIEGRESVAGLGIGTGIWIVLSCLISLFVGAYYAGRVSGLITIKIGRVQGLVISALFFGFLFSQLGAAVGSIGQGAGSMLKGIGSAAGDVSKNPQVQETVNKALGDLNLKSPPDEVAQGLTVRLLRGDTTGARNYLARQAGISQAEAQRRIDGFQQDFQNAARQAGSTAAKAVSIAGWTLFGTTLLGTLFAMLGGGIGTAANLKRPLSRTDEKRGVESKAA